MITTQPCACGCGNLVTIHRHADGRLNRHKHSREPRFVGCHQFQMPNNRAKCRAAKIGRMKETLAPNRKPTFRDIVWAAGFYEGEGSCGFQRVKSSGGTRMSISQKMHEPLEFMRARFGGRIRPHTCGYMWVLDGARSRGFLLTIYSLLSSRRRNQIAKAFGSDAAHLQTGKQQDANPSPGKSLSTRWHP